MAKDKKIVAPFLKPIAIFSIALGISATTAIVDGSNYKSNKKTTTTTTQTTTQTTQEQTDTTKETRLTETTGSTIQQENSFDDNTHQKTQDSNQQKNPTSQSVQENNAPSSSVQQSNNQPVDDGKTEETVAPDQQNAQITPKQDARSNTVTGGNN